MKQYDVFISYRRDGGFEMAQTIHDRLQKKGLRVFLDVEALRSGKFNEQLYSVIENCGAFVLIESPGALDRCVNQGDWVRLEIEHALASKKVIVPVMLQGFSYPDQLPESLQDLPLCNGIEPSKNYFDASMDKLYQLVAEGTRKKTFWLRRHKLLLACLGAVLAVVLAAGILLSTGVSSSGGWEQTEILTASQSDPHVLLKLANGNHQYEMGLENWRKLDYNRAQRDISQAREALAEEIGEDRVEMAKIDHSLGCLDLDMGRYQQAYDHLNSAYVTFRDTFGPEDSATLAVEFALAQYDYFTGDIDTALKSLQRISDKMEPEQNEIPLTLVRHFQGQIYEELGRYGEAEEIYRSVLTLYDRYLQDGTMTQALTGYTTDPDLTRTEKEEYTLAVQWISLTCSRLGRTCGHQGRTEEAREILEEALAVCLDNVYIGQKNLVTAELYKDLARLCLEQQDLKQGVAYIDLAMRIQKNVFDFEGVYPGLVEVYDLYGDLLTAEGEDAASWYQDALDLARTSYGENHPVTARALGAMGQYHLGREEGAQAEACFLEAIEIRKNILSYPHMDSVRFLTGLAEACRLEGRTEEMEEALTEARTLSDSLGAA